MSDAQAAKRWMPNRMFDPVSNPFAIQNLLEKEQPAFVVARDERPDDAFWIDALMSGAAVNAFEVDQRLRADEEPAIDAPGADGFVAESASATGFEAEPAEPVQPFMPEPVADAGTFAAADDLSPEAAQAHAVPVDEAAAPVAELTTVEPDQVPAAAIAEPEAPEPAAPAEPELDLLSSEAVQQMVEAARAEAYEQGLQAGLAQGREAERPAARQQGYDEGFAAGAAQARQEEQSERQQREQGEHEARLAQLQTVIDGVQQLAYDADALFEPMKRLSVHLAEQLVRGELAQSPQAISRLVDNALRELNASGDKAVIVHLNPEDLEAYRPTVAQFADSLILRPDHMLERGSVRVSLDGSVVEDLMQRRVAGLKRSLAQPAAPGWRAAGGKLSERLADGQRGSTQVEDVTLADKAERMTETAAPAQGDA